MLFPVKLVSILLCAGSIVSAASTDAPVVSGNSAGGAYQASFSSQAGIQGDVSFAAGPGGTGVKVIVSLSGLPTQGGPFLYHIHQKPVPSNGNCTGTLGHLDPYGRGETPPANPANPQDAQVGDLSGKHGTINSTAIQTTYVDNYLSLQPGTPAFIGGLSVVIHSHNLTRIACANITETVAQVSFAGSKMTPGYLALLPMVLSPLAFYM